MKRVETLAPPDVGGSIEAETWTGFKVWFF
jgi:hypothetical protein